MKGDLINQVFVNGIPALYAGSANNVWELYGNERD